MASETTPEEPARREAAAPGAINIQTVEIVIQSNQHPERIARAVLEELKNAGRVPRRFTPNYSSIGVGSGSPPEAASAAERTPCRSCGAAPSAPGLMQCKACWDRPAAPCTDALGHERAGSIASLRLALARVSGVSDDIFVNEDSPLGRLRIALNELDGWRSRNQPRDSVAIERMRHFSLALALLDQRSRADDYEVLNRVNREISDSLEKSGLEYRPNGSESAADMRVCIMAEARKKGLL